MFALECKQCHSTLTFDQPYSYHAGFENKGFLYNEAGNLTLVWSSFDRAYMSIVGSKHPWTLTATELSALECALCPSPKGDQWLFGNSPRCEKCKAPIGGPMVHDIYFLVYPGSVLTEQAEGGIGLGPFLHTSGRSG